MNDMRLGRSLESTLPACDGLLLADLVFSDGILRRDSNAGWSGSSLMCSGSRRTRLPNGAILGIGSAPLVLDGGDQYKGKEMYEMNGYWAIIVTSKVEC